MANILDYLRWRSDLTLWQYPLCEVDNLVLSQLANLRWEKMLQTDEQPTLCLLYTSDAADDLLCVDLGGLRIIKKNNE